MYHFLRSLSKSFITLTTQNYGDTMTKILFLLSSVLFLSACGSNSIIQSITVSSTVDQDQNQWVNLDSKIKLGALTFPSLSLPIFNPKNPGEVLGKVSLSTGIDGSNQLSVQANLNKLKGNALAQDRLLPNGDQIPISGMDGVVSIKIKDSSKIFVGANATQFMVGLALVIPAFDSIGKYIPGGASLFFPMPAASKINGVAGVFTGGQGQNGLGLFVLTPNTIQLNAKSTLAMKLASSQSFESTQVAQAVASDPTSSNSNFIKRSLYYLSLNPHTLNVK